jgi:hypothetical protein
MATAYREILYYRFCFENRQGRHNNPSAHLKIYGAADSWEMAGLDAAPIHRLAATNSFVIR